MPRSTWSRKLSTGPVNRTRALELARAERRVLTPSRVCTPGAPMTWRCWLTSCARSRRLACNCTGGSIRQTHTPRRSPTTFLHVTPLPADLSVALCMTPTRCVGASSYASFGRHIRRSVSRIAFAGHSRAGC